MLKRCFGSTVALLAAALIGSLPLTAAGDAANPARAVAVADPAEHLARIAADYFQAAQALDPIGASFSTGEERYLDQLVVSIAPAERARQRRLVDHTLAKLARIDADALAPTAQLTHQLLRRKLTVQQEGFGFPAELLPLDHYGGMPTLFAQFASGQSVQPLSTVTHYNAFLRRLRRLPRWNEQAIANMRLGLRQGIVQPRALVERAIETLQPLVTTPLDKHAYTLPLRQFPAGIGAGDRYRLRQAYMAEVGSRQIPSLRKLLRFLRQEYLPRARSTAGLSDLPGGAAWYAHRLREDTTTRLTADEIHAIGLREVARIRAAMSEIQARHGDSGPLSDFLRAYAQKSELRPFRSEREVLDAYAALDRRIALYLPALFGTLPATALDIRAEPEVSRATASDHYTPPSLDGARPGIFWAVITESAEYRTTRMTSLYLHEGRPGHHFHIARQQKMSLPDFRKHDWITAYGEGWALYAETLGYEMGLYEDADALLGHLQWDLHRAIRLVVDTGLHAKGWSREQAMAYMVEVEGATEADARRATERYMALPGQATAYKIGALKIRELRDLAQSRLGPAFSYSEFHEQILGEGSLPLDVLENKIRRWLD